MLLILDVLISIFVLVFLSLSLPPFELALLRSEMRELLDLWDSLDSDNLFLTPLLSSNDLLSSMLEYKLFWEFSLW